MTTSNVNQREDTTAGESRGNRRRTNEEQLDAVFEVLADARRRRIIRILRTQDGDTVPVPALAQTLATREPTDPEPDQLVISLRHVHLPKLDATGVIEYTAERSQVRYCGPSLVERLLDQV
ncbi:DUF7344 domain-containing protein [Haloplanus aerogenes]|uniref:DUF7344 domain-containing protein n=1 Tax=Haloplanus aerogenes TaxID=660522 RepID=A0A3M0CWI2_9EURY|nr:hypothetical protein [Haloplanus aerogenes]AZH23940.1 hypothetical protein DU502_00470 [Haloplanus aerogenes]RMB13297.1 hypothetical protein ATH50_2630 [Haloplanus aerogenes]